MAARKAKPAQTPRIPKKPPPHTKALFRCRECFSTSTHTSRTHARLCSRCGSIDIDVAPEALKCVSRKHVGTNPAAHIVTLPKGMSIHGRNPAPVCGACLARLSMTMIAQGAEFSTEPV